MFPLKSFNNVCKNKLLVLGLQDEALFEIYNKSYRLR